MLFRLFSRFLGILFKNKLSVFIHSTKEFEVLTMESIEERLERLEYYQSLILPLLRDKLSPLHQLIMEAKLTKKDVEDLLDLCEEMSIEYKKQKAEGLICFTPLLTQFVGMLHPHLDPKTTIDVLAKVRKYTPLMYEFKGIINKIN